MPAARPGPVVIERYLSALGADDPFESLRKAPARIRKLLRGLDEEALATPRAPGKWSIREVLGHLADHEVIHGARLRLVGAQDRPALTGYDQDAFVERLGVRASSAAELLRAFEGVRLANLGLLARLPDEAYERTGLHAERGPESIGFMVRITAGHDRVHEEQIRIIRAAIGRPLAARAGTGKRKRTVAARGGKKR